MGDLDLARSLYTVGCFLSFILVLLYAYNRRNKSNYDDEARRIIEDEDSPKQQSSPMITEHKE